MSSAGLVVRQVARVSVEIIDRLALCGSSTVSDAQDRAGLLGGDMRPIYPGTRIAGSAITVLAPPGDNWMVYVAIEQVRQADILVVVPTSPSSDAYVGDLTATSAKTRGCRGAMVEAGVRDVSELRRMDFPVWSRGVSARGPVRSALGSVNVPVVCAGCAIRPGDVIVADDDGVCVVSAANAETVLRDAEARLAREENRRRRLAAGELSLDIDDMRSELARLGLKYV